MADGRGVRECWGRGRGGKGAYREQYALAAVGRDEAESHRRRAAHVLVAVVAALLAVHGAKRLHRGAARGEARHRVAARTEQLRARALVRRAQQPIEAEQRVAPRVRLDGLARRGDPGEGDGQLGRDELRLQLAVPAQPTQRAERRLAQPRRAATLAGGEGEEQAQHAAVLVELAGCEARVGAHRGQALQRGELRLYRLAIAA